MDIYIDFVLSYIYSLLRYLDFSDRNWLYRDRTMTTRVPISLFRLCPKHDTAILTRVLAFLVRV